MGAALAALRIIRSPEGPELFARVLDNAGYLSRGLRELGFRVVEPVGTITPVVPVVVGDDWKAVLLWRALYDAGVYVNVAIHPAVPPGGALLRTSVMATHDRAVLDRALAAFENVKQKFEAEHGPLPATAPIAHSPDRNAALKISCSLRMRRVVERCFPRAERASLRAAIGAMRADAPERDTGRGTGDEAAGERVSALSGAWLMGPLPSLCARSVAGHANDGLDPPCEGGRQRGGSMDATATAPAPQHMRALEQANRVRLARAELKRQVAEGEVTAAEVVVACPWEAESMSIADLLMSQHRWGRTRCHRFLGVDADVRDQDDRLHDRAPAPGAGGIASRASTRRSGSRWPERKCARRRRAGRSAAAPPAPRALYAAALLVPGAAQAGERGGEHDDQHDRDRERRHARQREDHRRRHGREPRQHERVRAVAGEVLPTAVSSPPSEPSARPSASSTRPCVSSRLSRPTTMQIRPTKIASSTSGNGCHGVFGRSVGGAAAGRGGRGGTAGAVVRAPRRLRLWRLTRVTGSRTRS